MSYLRELVVVDLHDAGDVEGDLDRELPPVAEGPLVEVGLVQLRIELQAREAAVTGGVTITVSNEPSPLTSYSSRRPCASLPPNDGTGLRVPINCW